MGRWGGGWQGGRWGGGDDGMDLPEALISAVYGEQESSGLS